MNRTHTFAVQIVCLAVVAALGPRAMANRDTTNADVVPVKLPGQDLPVVREHTYRMAGKIRVLLLWVGRDDVGSGVIKWRAAGQNRAFEVLIGSEPQKAPNQLNKWGFLLEEIRGGESSVVGLISQENDDRLSDVKSDLRRRRDLRAFDTIRGLVTTVEGRARVGTLHAPSELTYHDVGKVLEDVFGDTSLAVKQVPRRGDVRAGFLSSLTEMIAGTLERKPLRRLSYIHGDRLYELRLLDSTPLPRFDRDGRTFKNVIRGHFETAEAGRRSGTRFELVYGAAGALAGVPILISYQPKWWLQVDLVLNS